MTSHGISLANRAGLRKCVCNNDSTIYLATEIKHITQFYKLIQHLSSCKIISASYKTDPGYSRKIRYASKTIKLLKGNKSLLVGTFNVQTLNNVGTISELIELSEKLSTISFAYKNTRLSHKRMMILIQKSIQ